MTQATTLMLLGALAGLWTACGTEEPSDGTTTDSATGTSDTETDTVTDLPVTDNYYPLAVGASWSYEETNLYGVKTAFTWTIKSKEKITFENGVGEQEVFVWENDLSAASSTDGKTQYIGDDGTRAVRYRQIVVDTTGAPTKQRDYVPGFLRLDRSKVTKGQKWTETLTVYENTMSGAAITQEAVSYDYEVIAVDESVTVPAGTFKCLVIQRSTLKKNTLEVKQYFFAKGVGKVKEVTEGDQEEALTAYTVTP